MENIIKRNYELPLSLRIIEGLTTNMLLGYLYAGGKLYSPLSFVYILHWMASFNQHVFPSYKNFLIDTHFIDMVVMEKMFYVFHSYWIYIVYLILLDSNQHHSYICFCKTMFSILCLIILKNTTLQYNMSHLLAAFFYVLSDRAVVHYKLLPKTFFHLCFHVCISYTSYLEMEYYLEPEFEDFDFIRKLVYSFYLWKYLQIIKN